MDSLGEGVSRPIVVAHTGGSRGSDAQHCCANGSGGVTDMTELATELDAVLTPDELAAEQAAEDAEIGDDEPEEAPDPTDEDTSGIELADPDEIAAMIGGDQGGED